MDPEQKATLLRNLLTASETRHAAIREADAAFMSALRQLLDQTMANGFKPAAMPGGPDMPQ